jgi:hypothetical protein
MSLGTIHGCKSFTVIYKLRPTTVNLEKAWSSLVANSASHHLNSQTVGTGLGLKCVFGAGKPGGAGGAASAANPLCQRCEVLVENR